MPRDRLTPLGRQLSSVLANLCPLARASSTPRTASVSSSKDRSFILQRPAGHSSPDNGIRSFHTSAAAQSSAVSAAIAPAAKAGQTLDASAGPASGKQRRRNSWGRLNRGTHIDFVSLAIQNVGRQELIYHRPQSKQDLSHIKVASRQRWHSYGANRKRYATKLLPHPSASHVMSLRRILASYIEFAASSTDQPEQWQPVQLAHTELAYLQSRGFGAEDVTAWAKIVLANSALDAACSLANIVTSQRGPLAVPEFVYMQILRRDYISARALRIILRHFFASADAKYERLRQRGIRTSPPFLAVVRLIRHAREVWPQAFPAIVDFFIRHLACAHQSVETLDPRRRGHFISATTHQLNKLMSLISLSPATLPLKDNAVQEAAIVRILRVMADFDPPLHPNREGYRAFIRLQLAQRKSGKDQLWAELKTLSWPPWKVSRTGMDDAIGPDQGISRAAETLQQMQEAGYALLDWEKAVQAYAGWDVDGTPTIQTRTIVPPDAPKFSKASAKWVARIESTRTTQEAWACYLAWEDLRRPPDENVYLAMFKRLLQEEKRQRKGNVVASEELDSDAWPLFPGDSQEIAPLPPSTHLYTYTRTAPPSVDEFYDRLSKRNLVFKGHLLAFVVANANTLQTGADRLEAALSEYPDIRGLISLDDPSRMNAIPTEVFCAAIKLFCRFANVSPRDTILEWGADGTQTKLFEPFLNGQQLNQNHLLIRAVKLLQLSRTKSRPAWNAALEGLTSEPNLKGMRTAVVAERYLRPVSKSGLIGVNGDGLDKCGGAMIAYQLVGRVLTLLRDVHVDLDATGFYRLCLAVENLAVAGLTILKAELNPSLEKLSGPHSSFTHYRNRAKALLRSSSHQERLKGEFRALVGEEDQSHFTAPASTHEAALAIERSDTTNLPTLLTIPNPALLHAYIRSLGWLADYEGLHSLVQWMQRHREELVERCSRDRSGKAMMRRSIVALRVFLERSWLKGAEQSMSQSDMGNRSIQEAAVSQTGRGQKILNRLESQAPPDLVIQVEDIIKSVDEWGSWPSEQEVYDYCQDTRFNQVK